MMCGDKIEIHICLPSDAPAELVAKTKEQINEALKKIQAKFEKAMKGKKH